MDNNIKKDNKAWVAGLQIFFRISFLIFIPVLIALFVGKKLDAHFKTDPYLLIVMMALSFTLSMVLIVKKSKEYVKDLEKNNK